MIGIAAKFAALDLLRTRLSASADPNLAALGTLLTTHSEFAHFGALGTAYGDFSPVRLKSVVIGDPGVNPYVAIWKLIFNVFGGDGTSGNPGLKPVLDTIRNLLDKLDQIAADEDLDALKGLQSEVDTLNQIAADLSAIITTIKGDGTLSNLGIVPAFQTLIADISRPAIIRKRPDGNVGFPSRFWTLRDFLSWRRTGRFAKKLWDSAQASGRDDLRAYALGWISSWSLSASGGSAVASIIGAPYRNQWWRGRFVSNYIDLWSWGHGEAGPNSAPYPGWPNLCDQDLHRRMEIPGSGLDAVDVMKKLRLGDPLTTALPAEFVDFWKNAYDSVYGDLGDERPKVTADSLQDAYAMAWLVLWFQTSPESLGCHFSMPVAPTDCGGSPPSWTNPAVPGDNGEGGGPPPPTVDPKVKPLNVICAILLAIVGIVAFAMGGWIIGIGAIAGVIALAATAGTIDWDKFRCDLAWYRLYMYNGLRALHDLLSLGALVHPYTFELSQDQTTVNLLQDLPTEFKTGDHLLKSRPGKEVFPAVPWDGSGFSWFNDVTGPAENPITHAARASAYPSGFLDDAANPLGSRSPFAPVPFPFEADGSGVPVGFINSTDAMLSWLTAPKDLSDLNLDGDRGLGFRTWHFVDDNWTNPVNIEPES